jgi:hypothetical protein
MTFKQAVAAAPAPVASTFEPGLQALAAHSNQVSCAEPRRFTGSIDLDTALEADRRNDPRWDYGVGLLNGSSERAIWIEVHPATTAEVKRVLSKLGWLKDWLAKEARALGALTRRSPSPFFWLATSAGVHIRPGSPQARELQGAGLDLPKRVLTIR